MTELQASRTLVKSPPELWAECSDAASLARHLGRFGEIRITRLDPETTVAWEGEHARGTVRLEPAGWGTKVILTAVAVGEDVGPPEPADPPAPVGVSVEPPEPVESPSGPEPEAVQSPSGLEPESVESPSEPEPESVESPRAEAEPMPAATAAESLPRRRRFVRLIAWLRGPDVVPEPKRTEAAPVPEADDRLAAPEPAEDPPPPVSAEQPPPAPPSSPDTDPEAALTAALDSLGQAHHRPYSRA